MSKLNDAIALYERRLTAAADGAGRERNAGGYMMGTSVTGLLLSGTDVLVDEATAVAELGARQILRGVAAESGGRLTPDDIAVAMKSAILYGITLGALVERDD